MYVSTHVVVVLEISDSVASSINNSQNKTELEVLFPVMKCHAHCLALPPQIYVDPLPPPARPKGYGQYMDEWQGEKLKSPNMVRAGLRKFLQTTGMTQTATHPPA